MFGINFAAVTTECCGRLLDLKCTPGCWQGCLSLFIWYLVSIMKFQRCILISPCSSLPRFADIRHFTSHAAQCLFFIHPDIIHSTVQLHLQHSQPARLLRSQQQQLQRWLWKRLRIIQRPRGILGPAWQHNAVWQAQLFSTVWKHEQPGFPERTAGTAGWHPEHFHLRGQFQQPGPGANRTS